ncbi:MAG: nucleotidyltransferase family protein, partial [Oscillospiraceae bacterium]|nr:nucleotidyltransferase family protein [Oscillospiraceae bacterium]
MKTAAVICEYNPLHLGHIRQFRAIRDSLGEDARIVCLMSGSYVQRGAPAIFDKSLRAKAALLSGADLVLELPVTYALSSAEGFARGGM